MYYRRDIDGLRAIAVIPVVLFHAGLTWLSGGFIGVDVFFVISGYLITGILIREINNKQFSLVKFYERRAKRILPALFFVILCSIPFSLILMNPSQLIDYSKSLIAITFFVSNILYWRQDDYFSASAEKNPFLHTWTLSVEEQFYILFPILLVLLTIYCRKYVLSVIVGVSLVSAFLCFYVIEIFPVASFYLLPTRAWELGFGAASALACYKYKIVKNGLLSTLGFIMIVTSIVIYDSNTPFPSLYTLLPVFGAVLLLVFGGGSGLINTLLSSKALVGIGLISYSAYLWHQPIFAFARLSELNSLNLYFMLPLAVFSFFLAYLTWRYIEVPFRNKNWLSLRATFTSTLLASSTLIVVGCIGIVNKGYPDRYDLTPLQLEYLSTAKQSPYRQKCHSSRSNYIEPDSSCIFNSDTPSVAVFGDSHTVELAFALSEKLKNDNVGVQQLSFSECQPPFVKGSQLACKEWVDQATDYLVNSSSIETVILSFRINSALHGDHRHDYPNFVDSTSIEYKQGVIGSLSQLVNTLKKSGKKVIYVTQAPELPFRIKDAIYHRTKANSFSSGDLDFVGASQEWWNERNSYIKDEFFDHNAIDIIDTQEVFCTDKYCLAGYNGISYYFDDNHISISGASLVADKIIVEEKL